MQQLIISLVFLAAPLSWSAPPTSYSCDGSIYDVEYHTEGINGFAMLNIFENDGPFIMATTAFENINGPFGKILSIVTRSIPNKFIERLTVVFPEINMSPDQQSVQFGTRIIRSISKTSLEGPSGVDGLITQVTGVEALSCEAHLNLEQ